MTPPHDKLDHAVYTLALALAGAIVFNPRSGLVLAALLGLAKEVYDQQHPGHQADVWDLAADAAGLATAWLVLWQGGLLT